MIITFTKSTAPSAKMRLLTGMESLKFKIAGVLFIALLGVSKLSAQTSSSACVSSNVLIVSTKMLASVSAQFNCQVYTILIAKNFPVIASDAEKLNTIEDEELMDYDAIPSVMVNREAKVTVTASEPKQIKKSTKNKFLPNINS